jgi:hypothetical protein
MTVRPTVYEIADGDVVLWSVDGTIHIKTVSKHNDPVELTEDEAIELSKLLVRLASEG